MIDIDLLKLLLKFWSEDRDELVALRKEVVEHRRNTDIMADGLFREARKIDKASYQLERVNRALTGIAPSSDQK